MTVASPRRSRMLGWDAASTAPIEQTDGPDVPGTRLRLFLALALGVLVAVRVYIMLAYQTDGRSDLDQLLHAGRALLAGRDPYLEIGPGRAFEWENGFFYPITGVVPLLPIAWLPREAANAVFAGVAAAALAWTLTARSVAPLLAFASIPVVYAIQTVQWSPLLTSALVVPAAGALLIAKPTIGAAIFAARPSWTAVVGGAALLVLSLVLQWGWPAAWLRALGETSLLPEAGPAVPYLAPVLLPGGVLALLALLRWRRPEARLVAALACVPQTPLMYEAVPLFVVPRTWPESLLLVAASYAARLLEVRNGPHGDKLTWFTASGTAMIWLLYLPCVVMVLRRPNEGAAPHVLDRLLARVGAPAWLRGRGAAEASP